MSFTKLDRIGCQVCLENFPNIGQFKSHIRGNEHHKQMATVFPKGKCNNQGYFCNINVMEYLAKHQPERMIIGLSMVTVCPQTELRLLFYLCHLCEESCTQEQIMDHLYSPTHLINYFTYTDPDVLSFSWIPGPSIFQDLKPVAVEDVKKNGNGVLQVLDLPKDLFNVIRRLAYTSAMSTLEENEKLASQLNESKPKRISVQSYVADPSRKHPLLGLQHLVEGLCDGESGKTFHLCTLCQITLRGHTIISHVISFDHVYRYINAWHPSTLRSKQCYTEYNSRFKTSMLHFARQAEERSETNSGIKQLRVTTKVFNLLEASYSKALDTLDTISRDCNGRSLITSIQPGDPLETGRSSVLSDKGSLNLKERPTKPSLKLRCQNCKTDYFMRNYTKHLNHWTHASEQRSIFGSAVDDEDQNAGIPYLQLFRLMKCPSEEPIIGLPFIVVCICSKVKSPAGYLCFACLEYFSEAEVLKHMSSQRHALFTVLRQRVPFAWYEEMDTKVLRQLALEEQQANGDLILKVFDIPYCIFSTLKFTFYNLTRGEELKNVQYHLRNDVPLLPNPKPEYPLLGQDFVVKYSLIHGQNSKEWRFLCLLCGRNLGRKESTAHMLSYEHARNFLEKAHCGSLDCSDVSRETLLDLAEQAAEIHPVSEIQTILLDEPLLDSREYLKAVEILQRVKWRQSNCELIPVLAAGKRLVSTEVLQEIGHAKEETQAESEKWTTKGGQSAVNKLHSISYTPPRRIPPKIEPNIPAETMGGQPGGATNAMKVRGSTATPETSSKGAVKSKPKTRMELDSLPGKKIKAEPKTRDKVETVPSVVAINEMKVTKEGVSTATPETSSKGPVKSQPETRMELDSLPGKKIKEEPKTIDEVESVPSVVALGQPGTPVNVKQEPENDGEEARVQSTESSITQMCTAECMEETAMPGKRKARGSSAPEAGIKRLRLCLEDVSKMTANPSGHLTGVDDRNATEKALLKDVKPARAQPDKVLASPPASPYKLWDFIKMKDREPVIGLHALFECICEPYAPIYLCKSCCVKVHEKDILGHITGMRHRMRYLKLQSINVKRQQLAVRIAAAEQERLAGFGEAQVVELTPEQYSEMSKQSFDFALLLCRNTMHGSPPTTKVLTCKPDAVRPTAAQKPSPSLALSTSSACGTGETTHVATQTKAEQTEYKVSSLPTLESGASVKGLDTDKKSQSTVTGKVFVPKIGIPSKTTVEKCIPAPSIISVAPCISLLPSQSRAQFAAPLVTSPKSIPSTRNTLTTVSKGVNASKFCRISASSKIQAQTGDKGQNNHDPQSLPEAKQPSLSVALMPTSNIVSLASNTGKTTHVPANPKVQQPGLLENKATSSTTLNSGASTKGSGTEATFKSTLIPKVLVPKIVIHEKIPVEKLIPAPSIISVAPLLSLSPSQTRVTFATPLVTSPKSIPSTRNTLTSKVVSVLKSAKLLGSATSSKIKAQTKGRTIHDPQPLPEAKQTSLSVALMPTSNTAPLASDSGKTTYVPPKPKAQKTGLPENKETSSSTLNSVATVKVSHTDANSQITVTSKSVVPEIGILAKTPVEEFIPAPFKTVATSLSISPSQSSVAVVKTPATSSKSIPSTLNTLTTSSKGINASKLVNPLRAVTPSKNAAPTIDQVRTNPDGSVECKSTPIPHSGIFSHPQPAVAALPTTRLLLSKPPGEQSTASTEQGMGSASPTTPVYSPSTFPPNHTAVADSSKVKSLIKNQPVVGTDSLVVVKCEKRRQSYCLLCSVRLRKGDHMTSNSHRYKYLKFHSFAWEMDEKRMLTAVTHLAELEKVQGTVVKTVEVNGEIYNRLATVSEEEALAKVKELLESQSHSSTKAEGLKCVSGTHAASRSADVEESDEVPHPMAAGSPTHAHPSLPRALEEPKKHITQPDPAPRREPSPQGPVGHPTAELDHRSSVNYKQNGERIPQIEQKGEKILGPSDLSTFLMVHCNTEPIIGLALVFECRALFEETFYLCGSCMKTFPIKLICKHIVSAQHQHTYMLKEYPQFMSWWDEDISPKEKEGLLKDISWKISETEVYDQMDAQVIMLRKDCYDYIRQAPFIKALDMLQNISREKRLNRLFGYQKQLGPQTPEAPSTRESMVSNTREKEGPPFPIYSVPQDIVNGGPTLPVVGIWAIVECSCEGQTPFYLCVACGNRLSQDLVLPHVKGQRHIQEYLSVRNPCADEHGVEPAQLLQPARGLEEQNLDEPGTMQRIALPQEDFIRIRTMTFDQALSSLKAICENQRQNCMTSRPRPAVKRHFEVGRSDADKVKHQRLSSPPADHVTQKPLKSSDTPWPAVEWSRLMDREEKVVREVSEPLPSTAHAPAPKALPDMHVSKSVTILNQLASSNIEANPDRQPASTPVPVVESMASLTRTQPVERAVRFPVSCPHSLSGSNTPAATVPLVSLTHEPKKGPVPSAHKPFKTGNSPVMNNTADIEMFSEAGGCSKDKTKHAVNHDPGSKVYYRHEESPKTTISYYPGQPPVSSSVPPATKPHAEITAGALLSQEDLGFQGNLRQEQIQTGTNHNSRLQQIRNGHNRRLLQILLQAPASSPPIVSTEQLAANLSIAACSGRTASTQNNSHTQNVTEETPGILGSQGYSTGQPGYPTTPYHGSGYLSYHYPSMTTVADPPLYPTHMNHIAVGTHRGGLLNQGLQQQLYVHYVLPNQAQSIVMARGLPQHWPGITPGTAVSHGATTPSYHGAAFSESAASYSQGLPNSFRNNAVMSDPGQPQGTPDPLNVQGFQPTTPYDCTSATAAGVMAAEGHPQGTAAFHFSNSAGNGTS